MRFRPSMALAASIAVLAIAIPITLQLQRPNAESSGPGIATQTKEPHAVSKDERLAPTPSQPVPPIASSPAPAQRADKRVVSPEGALLRRESGTNATTDSSVRTQLALPGSRGSGAPAPAVADAQRDLAAGYDRGKNDLIVLPPPGQREQGRDRFPQANANPVQSVQRKPVSTFSIDVDTASYGFVRQALNAGRLPPKQAVRIEEMINYFPYAYPLPERREAPFAPTVTVLPSPWNPANKLIHVAIKGYDVAPSQRPRANLVFLLDTSGSMAPEDRLPLLKNAFRMLVDTLQPDDTVAIVTYAGGTNIALEPTKVSEKHKIIAAIDQLGAGGSTAGAAGIELAYRMAERAFDKASVNRVILATDGDFNVGITDVDELKGFVERKRSGGIYLSILGVGRGNYNDALMQALAQNGNGVAAYIDTLNEARKVLAEETSSTLFPIAKDVKVQVEFNPARVSEYRLVGYETRMLRREDFNNDRIDAGDIGSGHTVTAIYEITPVGAPKLVDDLRYQQTEAAKPAGVDPKQAGEYGFLKIRYKLPNEETSRLIELPVTDALEKTKLGDASADVRFATAVAAFGQILRGDSDTGRFGHDEVIALASGARGDDPYGYRAEFINLVRLAKSARP